MNAKLDENKHAAIAFYELMFNECEPRHAIKKYVGDTYTQHNPHVGEGKEAFIEYFERMATEFPGKKVEVKRVAKRYSPCASDPTTASNPRLEQEPSDRRTDDYANASISPREQPPGRCSVKNDAPFSTRARSMRELKSPRLIVLKGLLFLVLGLLASATLLAYSPNVQTIALLSIAIWAFCRFYYFAFYVIEKYVDANYRFDGLLSLTAYLIRRSSTRRQE